MKDSNRLIAEFMDVFPRQGEERTGMKEFYSPIDLDISGLPDELTLADDLDFRQWHWIMPVVKKIKLMHVYLHSWKMITNPSDYPVDKVHEQVVEFIKQHKKKA